MRGRNPLLAGSFGFTIKKVHVMFKIRHKPTQLFFSGDWKQPNIWHYGGKRFDRREVAIVAANRIANPQHAGVRAVPLSELELVEFKEVELSSSTFEKS